MRATQRLVRSCTMTLLIVLVAGATAFAQDDLSAELNPFPSAVDEPMDGFAAVTALSSPTPLVRQRGAARRLAARDRQWIPPLVDQLFFVPKGERGDVLRVLAALAGERHERYLDWVGYVGNHPALATPHRYLGWKGALLARIDPRFAGLLRDGTPLRIRAEEIVCGGVPV